MNRVLRTMLAGLSFVLIPAAALAAISAGTELTGTLDQNLSSKDAQVGQSFTISNAHTADYSINGATIYGHVVAVQRAGQGTPGKITLAIDKVNTRSGNVYQATGYVTTAAETTKSNATKEAVGAIAGAVVGSILTHGGAKTTGTLAGAAGGYILAKNNRENVTIAQGTGISVKLSATRRQATPTHH